MFTFHERLQSLFGAAVYSLAIVALFSSLTTLAVADELPRVSAEPALAESVTGAETHDFGLTQVAAALRAETRAELAARLKEEMSRNRLSNERVANSWIVRPEERRLN